MGKMKEWMMLHVDEHELRHLQQLEREAMYEKIKWDEFAESIIRNRVGEWALVMYRNPDHLEKFVIEPISFAIYNYPTTILIGTSDKKEDLEMFCKFKSITIDGN